MEVRWQKWADPPDMMVGSFFHFQSDDGSNGSFPHLRMGRQVDARSIVACNVFQALFSPSGRPDTRVERFVGSKTLKRASMKSGLASR